MCNNINLFSQFKQGIYLSLENLFKGLFIWKWAGPVRRAGSRGEISPFLRNSFKKLSEFIWEVSQPAYVGSHLILPGSHLGEMKICPTNMCRWATSYEQPLSNYGINTHFCYTYLVSRKVNRNITSEQSRLISKWDYFLENSNQAQGTNNKLSKILTVKVILINTKAFPKNTKNNAKKTWYEIGGTQESEERAKTT